MSAAWVLVLVVWFFSGAFEEVVIASASSEAGCEATRVAMTPSYGSSSELFCVDSRFYHKRKAE